MPATVPITAYTLAELKQLPGSAYDRASQYVLSTDDNWYEPVLTDYRNWLAAAGFPDADISFSHMYRQGQGAGFTSEVDWDLLVAFMCGDVQPQEALLDEEAPAGYLLHLIGAEECDRRFRRLRGLGEWVTAKVF